MSDRRTSDGLEEDYLRIAQRRGPQAALATALRTRSVAARDLFAHAATRGSATHDDLVRLRKNLKALSEHLVDPEWAALLARLLALQNIARDDLSVSTSLYRAIEFRHGIQAMGAVDQEILVQLLLAEDRSAALRLLERAAAVRPDVRSYLEADLMNPFVGAGGTRTKDWLAVVRRRFFPASQESIELTGDALHPFDRLCAEPADRVDGPMVTVIVTAYRPDEGLLTSVQSLTHQSWQNLEILVVDDASGPDYADLLESVQALDDRVRLLPLHTNGGTYLARNAGLDAARGELVTFQDADDWTHPRRVERQVMPLLADSSIPATRSSAVRASDTLLFHKLGYLPERRIASSLMFRRSEALDRVGYFDRVRKAGDTEYHKRLELALGGRTLDLAENLSVVRMRAGSLSREEFRAGWHHPARYSYRLAYEYWHRSLRTSGKSPRLENALVERQFPAPRRFLVSPAEERRSSRLNVVFLSEWRRYGGPQKSMIEEIRALRDAGMTVGVAQIEAMRFMGTGRPPLCTPVQELINSGAVQHVLPDDDVDVDLVILRYPPVLQFPPADRFAWRTKDFWIVANQAPSEVDGSDRRYRVRECHDNAIGLLGCEPQWVPQSKIIRSLLKREWSDVPLAPFDNPGILDLQEWDLPRRRPHSHRPIIGRHSRDEALKWPGSPEDLLTVYPDTDDVDVRIMGGIGQLRHIMGEEWTPTRWLVYQYNELPVRHFLAQLDFFVYFHDARMHEAFGRSILEALATGCVVILPNHFREIFGDAALYCLPSEVPALVDSLHKDPQRFVQQSDRGRRRVREHFSHQSFRDLVQETLSGTGELQPDRSKITVSTGR